MKMINQMSIVSPDGALIKSNETKRKVKSRFEGSTWSSKRMVGDNNLEIELVLTV